MTASSREPVVGQLNQTWCNDGGGGGCGCGGGGGGGGGAAAAAAAAADDDDDDDDDDDEDDDEDSDDAHQGLNNNCFTSPSKSAHVCWYELRKITDNLLVMVLKGLPPLYVE